MRGIIQATAGCLIVALVAGPVLAQTTTVPKQEQQVPRNQSDTAQPPGMTSPDSSSATGTQDTTKDSTFKSGTSRDTTSSDGMRGMSGAKAGRTQVRQVQEALKSQGHDPGPVDGVMGPQTQEALRAYQRAQNLTETGQVDPQTSEKLGVGGGMSPSR